MDKRCCAQPMPLDLGGTFSASGRRPCPTCALDLLDLGFWLARFQRAAKLDWEEGRRGSIWKDPEVYMINARGPGLSVWDSCYFTQTQGRDQAQSKPNLGEPLMLKFIKGSSQVPLLLPLSLFCSLMSLTEPHSPL